MQKLDSSSQEKKPLLIIGDDQSIKISSDEKIPASSVAFVDYKYCKFLPADQALKDWNRDPVPGATIDGKSIATLLQEEGRTRFENETELKNFFKKHLLKNIKPENQDACVEKIIKLFNQASLLNNAGYTLYSLSIRGMMVIKNHPLFGDCYFRPPTEEFSFTTNKDGFSFLEKPFYTHINPTTDTSKILTGNDKKISFAQEQQIDIDEPTNTEKFEERIKQDDQALEVELNKYKKENNISGNVHSDIVSHTIAHLDIQQAKKGNYFAKIECQTKITFDDKNNLSIKLEKIEYDFRDPRFSDYVAEGMLLKGAWSVKDVVNYMNDETKGKWNTLTTEEKTKRLDNLLSFNDGERCNLFFIILTQLKLDDNEQRDKELKLEYFWKAFAQVTLGQNIDKKTAKILQDFIVDNTGTVKRQFAEKIKQADPYSKKILLNVLHLKDTTINNALFKFNPDIGEHIANIFLKNPQDNLDPGQSFAEIFIALEKVNSDEAEKFFNTLLSNDKESKKDVFYADVNLGKNFANIYIDLIKAGHKNKATDFFDKCLKNEAFCENSSIGENFAKIHAALTNAGHDDLAITFFNLLNKDTFLGNSGLGKNFANIYLEFTDAGKKALATAFLETCCGSYAFYANVGFGENFTKLYDTLVKAGHTDKANELFNACLKHSYFAINKYVVSNPFKIFITLMYNGYEQQAQTFWETIAANTTLTQAAGTESLRDDLKNERFIDYLFSGEYDDVKRAIIDKFLQDDLKLIGNLFQQNPQLIFSENGFRILRQFKEKGGVVEVKNVSTKVEAAQDNLEKAIVKWLESEKNQDKGFFADIANATDLNTTMMQRELFDLFLNTANNKRLLDVLKRFGTEKELSFAGKEREKRVFEKLLSNLGTEQKALGVQNYPKIILDAGTTANFTHADRMFLLRAMFKILGPSAVTLDYDTTDDIGSICKNHWWKSFKDAEDDATKRDDIIKQLIEIVQEQTLPNAVRIIAVKYFFEQCGKDPAPADMMKKLMAKPELNTSIKKSFTDGYAAYLSETGDPAALAAGVKVLKDIYNDSKMSRFTKVVNIWNFIFSSIVQISSFALKSMRKKIREMFGAGKDKTVKQVNKSNEQIKLPFEIEISTVEEVTEKQKQISNILEGFNEENEEDSEKINEIDNLEIEKNEEEQKIKTITNVNKKEIIKEDKDVEKKNVIDPHPFNPKHKSPKKLEIKNDFDINKELQETEKGKALMKVLNIIYLTKNINVSKNLEQLELFALKSYFFEKIGFMSADDFYKIYSTQTVEDQQHILDILDEKGKNGWKNYEQFSTMLLNKEKVSNVKYGEQDEKNKQIDKSEEIENKINANKDLDKEEHKTTNESKEELQKINLM